MKRVSRLTVGAVFVFAGFFDGFGIELDQGRASVLLRVAESNDLSALRRYVEVEKLEIGPMLSAWKVGQLDATSAVRKLETNRREIGLALCGLLTRQASKINNSHDITQLETAASNLLWLASWLEPHSGYGNIFIEARAYDLATVAVARLFCNTNYPLEKYPPWLVVTNSSWDSPERRARILFMESGGFGFSPRMTNQTQAGMQNEWGRCRNLLKDGSSPIREIFEHPLPGHTKFFIVPELGWTNTMHRRVGLGLEWPSRIRDGLVPLYEFRKTIGYFPANSIGNRNIRGFEGAAAGFIETWWPIERDNYSNPKLSQIGAKAGRIYQAYIDGTLQDEGTKQLSFPE